jgi:hypothetical protein
MAAQALGSLIATVSILWFMFTLTLDRAGQQQAVLSLWGVVGFVGGLILWALGRIECALPPSGERGQRGGMLVVLPFLVVLLALAMAVAWLFLGSSPHEAKPTVPQMLKADR